MKLNRKLLRSLWILLAVLLPISFILRIYTYWKELDVVSGFFSGNSAGCITFNIIGFVVFFLCLLLTYVKNGSLVGPLGSSSAPKVSKPVAAPDVNRDEDFLLSQEENLYDAEVDYPQYFLQGFAKKCAIWEGTLSAFAALLPGFAFIVYALSFFLNKNFLSDPYQIIFAALSLLSGAFFLFFAARNSCERSRFVAFLALVPAFWCTMRMVIEYRDLTRFLNKSLYTGQFLFVIAVLVFFLYQAQMLLGENALARPNAYVFSGTAAAFLGLTARLPQLIAVMGERISLDLVDASSLLMDLAITFFIVCKLVAVTKRK